MSRREVRERFERWANEHKRKLLESHVIKYTIFFRFSFVVVVVVVIGSGNCVWCDA